jgi:hypothetical protein
VEDRWRRSVVSGLMGLAVLAGAGTVAAATSDPWWDPPPCIGGPAALVAATQARANGEGETAWTEITPVLDATGTLVGQRLVVGSGSTRHRLDLPPESFAAGPFGRVVLVGDDDGRRSRLRAIDAVAGCAWPIATEASVIRRATLTPDGRAVLEMRVGRRDRADQGIWQRTLTRPAPPRRILPPIAMDGRFGRTWSTEFTWSVDGDRVAVQSCGAAACRTRVLDPWTERAELVDDPDLGPIVGLSRDRLVVYRACRGLPCGVVSVDPTTHARSVLTEAAGRAVLTGHGTGIRVVHEWLDGLGMGHVRGVELDGTHPTDLGRPRPDLPLLPGSERSR